MRRHIHSRRPRWSRRTASRAAPLLLAAVLAGLGLMAAPGPASASPLASSALATWPQFGHDPQHTGFNPDESIITRDTVGTLGVEYIAAGPGDPQRDAISQSSPAVVGSVAYVGTDDGFLLALPANGCGAANCNPLWTATLANGAFTTPAVAGGLVFISSAGSVANGIGTLYAFKAAGCGHPNCRPVWTASVPNVGSSPTVAGGVLYIVASDGRLLAFKAEGCGRPTCAPLWTANAKSSAEASPAVGNGLVYVTSTERLVAFPAAGCGQAVCPPVWASEPVAGSDTGSGLIQGVGPTLSGDKVYFASVDFASPDGKTSTVYAFPAAGCGTLNCQPLFIAHPADFDSIQSTMTVANGVLYASTGGSVYAFDANGCGQPVCGFLWLGVLPGTGSGTLASPSVAGGVVYQAQFHQFGGFDARGCGQQICSPLFTGSASNFATTPVIVNGRLYVAAGPGAAISVYRPALPPVPPLS